MLKGLNREGPILAGVYRNMVAYVKARLEADEPSEATAGLSGTYPMPLLLYSRQKMHGSHFTEGNS